jgi:hypothetical protein
LSALTVFGFYQDGDAFQHSEVANSFGGGWFVWEVLAKKYNCTTTPLLRFKQVWDHCNNGKMSDLDTLVCLFTLDWAWIKKENIPELADGLIEFQKKYGEEGKVDVLSKVAKALREMIEDDNVIGAGFNMTDVSEAHWYQFDGEADEYVPYNVLKGDNHWDLYEDFVASRGT